DQIRKGIGFRAYGHKDPKIEYQKESFALFETMMRRIRDNTVEYIFKVKVEFAPRMQTPMQEMQTQNLQKAADVLGGIKKENANLKIKPKDLKKIGRNDPCPCGSGKKYKKCCGKNL
ncbi:MAG: SEC-C domain-containing protein, partial [Elusimicrobiota bacterium]|nr:SEC-C domain-containing protein [Elusimicrobiota bacterium]